ncbi:MAG: winged helix-turn-helix transcriptional regulator [Acidobacteria bacterium]|nr:winged helix-turn-helix transcriptional regulator [Acidobacteriota bacterium]
MYTMRTAEPASADLWAALAGFRERVFSRMQPGLADLDGLDLTLAQSIALQHIASAGPLPVAALQARLSRAQASTSQLVTQLERRGLAERRADPADGRRTLVALSARGRRQMARLDQVRRQGFESVVAALPPAVRRQLVDALRATLEALAITDARKDQP